MSHGERVCFYSVRGFLMFKAKIANQEQFRDVFDKTEVELFEFSKWFTSNCRANGRNQITRTMQMERREDRLRTGLTIWRQWLTRGQNPRLPL